MSYQENQISEEEHTNTDNVVCPHCGYYDELDSQQDFKNKKGVVTCQSCEKRFRYIKVVTAYSYTTQIIK